jgi:hypothetical protein
MENRAMNTEHTPGPWTAMPMALLGPQAKRFQVRGRGDAGPTSEFVCENARFANARLIEAAPELLEACREAVSAITYLLSNDDDDPNYADTLNKLGAAIAKAEEATR